MAGYPSASDYRPVPTEAGKPHKRQTLFQRWRSGSFSIMPEDNPILDKWDLVVIAALFFTAVEVPFEVALMQSVPPSLYHFEKVIDAIFLTDMIVSFNVALKIHNATADATDLFERRPAKIAAEYMAVPFSKSMSAGWFWPDLFTLFPWEIVGNMKEMRNLRIIRVLRLVRMLRLVRIIKLFQRWHMQIGVSFALVKLMTCFSVVSMITHWLACLWGMIGLHPDDQRGSWLFNHLTAGDNIEDMATSRVYTQALYLCTVVLTTVGFGDIFPTNNLEVALMIITIFFTAVTWAWVVANVVNVITNRDPFGDKFNHIMDGLNSLMVSQEVRKPLQIKVRRHIHESYNVQRRRHHQEAIHWLSAGLQGEMAIAFGMDQVCNRIWYFRGASKAVLIELADEFLGDIFGPNESITDRSSLLVVMRGSCMRKGKLCSRDAVLFEDIILSSEQLRDSSCPRTLSFMEAMTLHRDRLCEAAGKFPDFSQRLRKGQIRLALWRAFVRTAEKIKRERTKSKAESLWDQKYFATSDAPDDPLLPKSRSIGWEESMDQSLEKASEDSILQLLSEVQKLGQELEARRASARQLLADMAQRLKAVAEQQRSLDSCLHEIVGPSGMQRSTRSLGEMGKSEGKGRLSNA